jgi:hypothetical protein
MESQRPATIGTLIPQGLSLANCSWPAIGIVLLASLLWAGAWSVVLDVTQFPAEALQELQDEAARQAPPTQADTSPPANTEDHVRQQRERAVGLLQEWAGRAWPYLLLMVWIGLMGWVWLTAGQLGYLNAQLQGRASLGAFAGASRQAFIPVIQTVGVMLLFGLGAVAGWGLLFVLAGVLGRAMGGLGAFLGVVGVIGGALVFVWVGVKIAYWMIAVVVDRAGPLRGLKRSVDSVRGRWWRTFWFLAVWGLIGLGVGLCLQLAMWLLRGLGPPVGGLVRSGLETFANVFVSFAINASLIAWYRQIRGVADVTPGGVS